MRKVNVQNALLFSVITLAVAQTQAAPFRNLDFDEANTNTSEFPFFFQNHSIPEPQGFGPAKDLLPGWKLYKGTNPVDTMIVNTQFESNFATIMSPPSGSFFGFPVDGKYALMFGHTFATHFSLVQRGDIPTNANFLTYASRFPLCGNG